MRVVLLVMLLAATTTAKAGASQTGADGFLPYPCDTVARQARAYLSVHGLNASARAVQPSFRGLTIQLPDTDAQLPWTDAKGRRVTDFEIFWRYSNRKTGDKRHFAAWRIRMSRYIPDGAIELDRAPGGCQVDFHLSFEAAGTDVIAILPLDSQWGYDSNGRLEQGYLHAIIAELKEKFPLPGRP